MRLRNGGVYIIGFGRGSGENMEGILEYVSERMASMERGRSL
jgi:hypothetical protein